MLISGRPLKGAVSSHKRKQIKNKQIKNNKPPYFRLLQNIPGEPHSELLNSKAFSCASWFPPRSPLLYSYSQRTSCARHHIHWPELSYPPTRALSATALFTVSKMVHIDLPSTHLSQSPLHVSKNWMSVCGMFLTIHKAIGFMFYSDIEIKVFPCQ